MKKAILASSVLAFMTTSGAVTAQESSHQAYVGANYVFATYEEEGVAKDIDLGALIAKVGAKINPYVAAELRAGFGVTDESFRANDISAEIELDYLMGGYAVFGLPNETPVYPYVVVGYTKGKLSISATGPGGSASASASESDMSYGVGANFSLSDNIQMNAEYMQYLDKDGAEISGVSIGASYLF